MLPPARRTNDNYVFVDADTYQAAILNTKLPPGFRLEVEATVISNLQKRQATLKQQQKTASKTSKSRHDEKRVKQKSQIESVSQEQSMDLKPDQKENSQEPIFDESKDVASFVAGSASQPPDF